MPTGISCAISITINVQKSNYMRHLIILIIAFVGIILTASAKSFSVGSLSFDGENQYNTAKVTSCDDNAVYVVIPKFVHDPETNHRYLVTGFFDRAFKECEAIESIEVPSSITAISEYCFYGCTSLKTISFPESNLSFIGDGAFANCTSLKTINIPESCDNIGNHAFQNCRSLTSISIPQGIMDIKYGTFEDCQSLTDIDIPQSVTTIYNDAFKGCSSLKSVNLKKTLRSIEESAFMNCSSLSSIDIPNSVYKIGEKCFQGCSNLTDINVGTSNKRLYSTDGVLFSHRYGYYSGDNQLVCYPAGKRETTYYIPDGTWSILSYAIDNPYLEILCIPESIELIEREMFGNTDSRIHSIYSLPIVAPTSGEYGETSKDWFAGINNNAIIYIPKGSLNSYWTTWQYFSDFREFDPSSVDAIQEDLTGIIQFKTSGHTLSISNKPVNAICRVFNASGILLTETTDNEIAIPQSGLYIVEVEGTTQKVII